MSVTLDYEKQPASGYVKVTFSLPNAFANWKSPTATELNAGQDVSKALSWNDYSFGTQASNTTTDPSFADIGNVQSRGASQFGGDTSFYYPKQYDDASNIYSVVEDIMAPLRVHGYLTVRIDGNKPSTDAWAANDLYRQYEVLSDGEANVITGEDAFRYTKTWLQQGNLFVSGVVRGTTNTVLMLPATATAAVGDVGRITATLNTREYTNGLVYTTSDPTLMSVTPGGVWTALAAGAPMVTGTDPATGVSDTTTITVS